MKSLNDDDEEEVTQKSKKKMVIKEMDQEGNATITLSTKKFKSQKAKEDEGKIIQDIATLSQLKQQSQQKSLFEVYHGCRVLSKEIQEMFDKQISFDELLSFATMNQVLRVKSEPSSLNFDDPAQMAEYLRNNGSKFNDAYSLKFLSKGGQSVVYRAELQQPIEVVVKSILPEPNTRARQENMSNIISEAHLIKLLTNKEFVVDIKEEIIEINEKTNDIENYLCVIEQAQNDLGKVVKIWSSRDTSLQFLEFFSNEKLFYFLYKTCEAVAYLHDNQIYYGDMKEANVLVFRDYLLKLGDFGISIRLDPSADPEEEIYDLKGLTQGYTTEKILNAMLQEENVSYNDLIQNDYFALTKVFTNIYNHCLSNFTIEGQSNIQIINHRFNCDTYNFKFDTSSYFCKFLEELRTLNIRKGGKKLRDLVVEMKQCVGQDTAFLEKLLNQLVSDDKVLAIPNIMKLWKHSYITDTIQMYFNEKELEDFPLLMPEQHSIIKEDEHYYSKQREEKLKGYKRSKTIESVQDYIQQNVNDFDLHIAPVIANYLNYKGSLVTEFYNNFYKKAFFQYFTVIHSEEQKPITDYLSNDIDFWQDLLKTISPSEIPKIQHFASAYGACLSPTDKTVSHLLPAIINTNFWEGKVTELQVKLINYVHMHKLTQIKAEEFPKHNEHNYKKILENYFRYQSGCNYMNEQFYNQSGGCDFFRDLYYGDFKFEHRYKEYKHIKQLNKSRLAEIRIMRLKALGKNPSEIIEEVLHHREVIKNSLGELGTLMSDNAYDVYEIMKQIYKESSKQSPEYYREILNYLEKACNCSNRKRKQSYLYAMIKEFYEQGNYDKMNSYIEHYAGLNNAMHQLCKVVFQKKPINQADLDELKRNVFEQNPEFFIQLCEREQSFLESLISVLSKNDDQELEALRERRLQSTATQCFQYYQEKFKNQPEQEEEEMKEGWSNPKKKGNKLQQLQEEEYQRKYLHDNWMFKQVGTEKKYSAYKVPGTVHQDLLALQLIPDPYYRNNLSDIDWIEKLDFEYSLNFDIPQDLLAKNTLHLVFDGLDTHASIYLVKENGEKELILEAHNQFRQYSVNIKGKVAQANNQLLIHFQSAVQYDQEQAKKTLPLVVPILYPDDPNRMYSRKAAYQYGWDWGPRIITCGIWKPVYIEGYNMASLNHIHVVTSNELTDMAGVEVQLDVSFDDSSKNQEFKVEILRKDTGEIITQTCRSGGKQHQLISLPFNICHPKLWWTHNIGEPFLYQLEIKLLSKDGTTVAFREQSFGVRTVELIQEEQQPGQSFFFKLNGRPVFLKGSNYIPPDMLMPRVTNQLYEEILQNALDANYNALRIWGGGNYENDVFYDLCDQKGILLWQDFMFANTMFPGTEEFFKNIREEVTQNVKRIRNHPSVLLWCGNNEIYEGWLNWGWQDNLSDKQKDDIYSYYFHIFHEIIPEVLKVEDKSRPYWSTSPLYGWGHQESLLFGDSHYWGVFAGRQDIEQYNVQFGKFNSEFGMQGMPSMNSIKKFSLPIDWQLDSKVMLTHQRHPRQYGNLKHYINLYYQSPSNFEFLTYVSQAMQSYAMKTAFESHRRNKPTSMGTLMWQLNDVWPVTSWSAVDYYGAWKAVHYQSKRLFADIFISAFKEKESLYSIYVVSEKPYDFTGCLTIKVLNFEGSVLFEKVFSSMSVLDNDSKKVFQINASSDLKGVDLSCAFIYLSFLSHHDQSFIENTQYFVRPLNLGLNQPKISVDVDFNSKSIELSCASLAKDVYIYIQDLELKLTDNYFDLIPSIPKRVQILNQVDWKNLKNSIKVISLFDSYQKEVSEK